MKQRISLLIASLLFIVAGMQTADAQGFRVYQSDGTELQFSLKTDSIVFDNGLTGDEVFGPFTPVNECIAKKWYISKTETYTFNADGTTDYLGSNSTYKFFPYQGTVVIYNAAGRPVTNFRVLEVTADQMLVSEWCNNYVTVWATTPQPVLVEDIVLSDMFLTLAPGETKDLIATVMPDDADNPAVTWESSDEEVAEVSKKGKVIANDVGTCIITCRATDGSGVYAQCEVTVSNMVYVQLIELSETSIALNVDKEYQLNAFVYPYEATNREVTWESSNESIATVDAYGLVRGVGAGTCTITCRATDGSGKYAECQATVGSGDFGMINGHEWVKIGGLKWATMNVGAATVAGSYATCFGDYFYWGETEPRYSYIYRTSISDFTFTWKSGYSSGYYDNGNPGYSEDILDKAHDAATANWGGTWRTPTSEDFIQLIENCSGSSDLNQPITELSSSITEGGIYWLSAEQTFEPAYTGVAGVLFVSKDDIIQRVFFPAAGYVEQTSYYSGNEWGAYWSAEASAVNARIGLYIQPSQLIIDGILYNLGLTIRPVSD